MLYSSADINNINQCNMIMPCLKPPAGMLHNAAQPASGHGCESESPTQAAALVRAWLQGRKGVEEN